MEALKQRILQDGTIIDNRILKIDNFLNHQIDTDLVLKMGEEFAKRLKDVRIDRIVTRRIYDGHLLLYERRNLPCLYQP